MAAKKMRDVVKRWQTNPIITVDDIPFPCNTVFNAAAVKLDDQYVLLLRVEDMRDNHGRRWPNPNLLRCS